jgi:hypothetical protein
MTSSVLFEIDFPVDFDFLSFVYELLGILTFSSTDTPGVETLTSPENEKALRRSPTTKIGEPNAGLVSLTMTCLRYLVFMSSDNLAR